MGDQHPGIEFQAVRLLRSALLIVGKGGQDERAAKTIILSELVKATIPRPAIFSRHSIDAERLIPYCWSLDGRSKSYVSKIHVRLLEHLGGGAREHGEGISYVCFADADSDPAGSAFLPNFITTG